MTRRQAAKETAGGRTRLTVYLSKEDTADLYALLDEMPIRLTVSGFIEKAIKDAVVRVREEGIKPPPRK